jgi:hypothetical protein
MKGPETQSLLKVRWAVFALLSSLAACVGQGGPPGPRYADMAAGIPPQSGDRARLFFYREWESDEVPSEPGLYLNGQRVGVSIAGGVFYRDVSPGRYLVTVDTVGTYWNQFKTVDLRAGETDYIKIESAFGWQSGFETYEADTFVVVPVDAADGQREIAQLKYLSEP